MLPQGATLRQRWGLGYGETCPSTPKPTLTQVTSFKTILQISHSFPWSHKRQTFFFACVVISPYQQWKNLTLLLILHFLCMAASFNKVYQVWPRLIPWKQATRNILLPFYSPQSVSQIHGMGQNHDYTSTLPRLYKIWYHKLQTVFQVVAFSLNHIALCKSKVTAH